MGQANLLIFLHIPKNGGTTLNHILGRQYPGKTFFWFSYDRPELISQYESMGVEEKADLRCLAGHVPFGLHEQFPDISTSYITMFRDPVSRFFSEYGHLTRGYKKGGWKPPVEHLKSIGDFLNYRIETNAMDVQTRFISGYMPPPGAKPPFNPLPEDALEKAKQNLKKHFVVTGITERFDESILLMKRRLGWQGHIFYARKNTAPRPVSHSDIPTEVLQRIREHTRNDAELVRYAGELLDMAILEEGEGFQNDLRRLHSVNHGLFLLSSTWKRILPPKIRRAPGVRHVGAIVHKVLR